MTQQYQIDYTTLGLNELAELVKQGQQEAFRHIVQRCNQRLFRVAIAVVNDDQTAQDALQEAYIKAYTRIHSFRGDAQLTTWLTRIVLNECYQTIRSQKPTTSMEVLEEQHRDAHVIPFPNRSNAMTDPIANTAQGELKNLLEQAISELPDKLRTVFVLREIENFSTLETASILDISEATAKTRLHRARKQLQEKLNQHLSASLDETFLFLGDRCANMTNQVMERIKQLS